MKDSENIKSLLFMAILFLIFTGALFYHEYNTPDSVEKTACTEKGGALVKTYRGDVRCVAVIK